MPTAPPPPPTVAPTVTSLPPTATPVPATATPFTLQPPLLLEPANNQLDATGVDVRLRWAAPTTGLPAGGQYQAVIVYILSGQEQSDALYTGSAKEAVASIAWLESKRAQDNRFWWLVRVVNAQGQPLPGTETDRWGFIWRPKPALRPTPTPLP